MPARRLLKLIIMVGVTMLFITAGSLFAGKLEDAISRSFPKFKFHQKAGGDLNGDGIDDIAVILWEGDGVRGDDSPSPLGDPYRRRAILLIYTKDVQGDFHLQTTAPWAICVGCGGVKAIMGEPLGELKIAKGILSITYVGGSREYWTDILKWRWDRKQKEFLLIGETFSSEDTLAEDPPEYIDINYSTQKAIWLLGEKKQNCQISSAPKDHPLTSFDFDNSGIGARSKILKQCTPAVKPPRSLKKTK